MNTCKRAENTNIEIVCKGKEKPQETSCEWTSTGKYHNTVHCFLIQPDDIDTQRAL